MRPYESDLVLRADLIFALTAKRFTEHPLDLPMNADPVLDLSPALHRSARRCDPTSPNLILRADLIFALTGKRFAEDPLDFPMNDARKFRVRKLPLDHFSASFR